MKRFHRFSLLTVAAAGAAAALILGAPEGLAAPAESPATTAWPAASIDADQYRITVDTPVVSPGAAGRFTVKVEAKDGFKFNKDFPTKLKLGDPPAGLEFPKPLLKKGDGTLAADGKGFTFDVPVKATRAGEFPFDAVLKFSVCNDSKCVVQRQTLASKIVAH